MSEKRIEVGSHTVELSSTEKVMFPDDGITKGDVIDYYERMAETMLPYMTARPVTMHRFPNGVDAGGFYQKEAPNYFPDWIERVLIDVEGEEQQQEQITCENAATLVYLANQGCITPHIWLSRVDKLNHPDRLIFDLDPSADNFKLVLQAAHDLRAILEEVNLASYLMTTGSRGLHVVVPLDRSADFDTVRTFSHDLASVLAARHPERLTTEQRKAKRRGRLFLDYLRNAYAQNSVAPYSLRAKPGAPVATPIEWGELSDSKLDSRRYNLQNIFRRLGQMPDPWQEIDSHAYSLDEPRRLLQELS